MRKLGKIRINDEVIDLDAEFGDLVIRNLTEGMTKVAALMSRCASLWGDAEEERVVADALYRQWSAQYAESIRESASKISADAVKAKVESHPSWLACKREVGRTEKNCVTLKGLFASLAEKGSQLQSRGAMSRAELDATDIRTREADDDLYDKEDHVSDRTRVEPGPPPRRDIRGMVKGPSAAKAAATKAAAGAKPAP